LGRRGRGPGRDGGAKQSGERDDIFHIDEVTSVNARCKGGRQ
jgi:hypothetical protein